MNDGQFMGETIDFVVIGVYFAAVVGFGLYFGRYTKNTKDFFFGGQRFAWWLIAFSGIATTVGSYSFVKYSRVAYEYGICSTQSYLNDWFWMPILLFIWLPIIYYQRVTSVPEYFERRFGRANRIAATCLILVYLVGYIGINLITLGRVLNTLLGWNVMAGAAVTAILVTLYVIVGGQTSVIMTDLAQGIILLIAGLGLFLAGVYHFGGFGDFWALLPESHKYAFSDFNAPDKFSFIGIYTQDGLANTGAFVLMNQGMIMRFLSLKSVKDARRMAVCWILVLAPLAAVAVSGGGWIAKALAEEAVVKNTGFETTAGDAFVNAAWFLCRPGIFGFILAALTAALMSTADTLINAVSAVFVNDIWKPFILPNQSDKHYLGVARLVSLGAAAIGLGLVPIFMSDSIYGAHGMFTAAVTPPIVMAIFIGVLWKRFTPAAAFATMVGGGILVGLSFAWPDALVKPFAFGMGEDSYKFMRALYGIVVCGILGIIVSLFTKPRPASALVGLVTGTQLEAMRMFKGGEINRRAGKKAKAIVRADSALGDPETAILPRTALDIMAADPGDLLYAADKRWWYGGLRSVHVKAGEPGEPGEIRLHPDAMATAHFKDGQEVIVEKIM